MAGGNRRHNRAAKLTKTATKPQCEHTPLYFVLYPPRSDQTLMRSACRVSFHALLIMPRSTRKDNPQQRKGMCIYLLFHYYNSSLFLGATPEPLDLGRASETDMCSPLSDPATNTAELNSQLLAMGLYAAPTVGDGNCLFRALSDQLYGSDVFHVKLRKDVCDWIERHEERYEPFVEDERGLETHLGCMRQNATYGGHMELSAFAHLTKRNVKVIQPGLVYVIEWDAGWEFDEDDEPHQMQSSPSKSSKRESKQKYRVPAANVEEAAIDATIYVAYHDWEHFSSIRNMRGPHAGIPLIHETRSSHNDNDHDDDEYPIEEKWPKRPKPYAKPKSRSKSKRASSIVPEPQPICTSTSVSVDDASTTAASSSATAQGPLPKIKLRLSRPPLSTATSSTLSSLSSLPSTVTGGSSHTDPLVIPLPVSRSPSPATLYAASSSRSMSQVPSACSIPPGQEPPSTPRHVHARVADGRSPKRSFDESSSVESEGSSSSKRTKREHGHGHVQRERTPSRLASSTSPPPISSQESNTSIAVDDGDELSELSSEKDAEGEPDPDVPPHPRPMPYSPSRSRRQLDEDNDDPAISPTSANSRSTPSLSRSHSDSYSSDASYVASDVEDGSPEPSEPPSSKPVSRASSKPVSSVSHFPTRASAVKPLTRRQRKALGLPKKGNGSSVADDGNGGRKSAGTIRIPGGRFQRPGVESLGVNAGQVNEKGEWVTNGAGSMDVRGFRELKI
ncbi:hypothetical protein BDV98DRAFT_259638 [Pterulicium gracile]|uniref:OTU domain-containing protein n=1 Tax=Pterulicium gracile TaxID=1884261 RepID=A0A5C3Q7M2_9AGAR|nr:hypothetical protein BDV98DRAFT_259638 [Pterula gracilis]